MTKPFEELMARYQALCAASTTDPQALAEMIALAADMSAARFIGDVDGEEKAVLVQKENRLNQRISLAQERIAVAQGPQHFPKDSYLTECDVEG